MKTNAYAIKRVLPSRGEEGETKSFPQTRLEGRGWTKFGFLEDGYRTWEHLQLLRAAVKKGVEPWRTLYNCICTWRFSIKSTSKCCRHIIMHVQRVREDLTTKVRLLIQKERGYKISIILCA